MRKALVVAVLLLLSGGLGELAACTSSTGCTDCGFGADNKAKCTFVTYDAECECTVTVIFGSTACAFDGGACDYQAGGGGGGGTGGGGGGGDGCTRTAGGWCPAECASCGTVYCN
jgi:hypothetical protein